MLDSCPKYWNGRANNRSKEVKMEKNEYYSKKLSALRLKRCYDIASPRIKQYLEAEIQFVLDQIKSTDVVLELGCGYGRVMARLAQIAEKVHGIDTSDESLRFAREFLRNETNFELYKMNASSLNFKEQKFEMVIAIQNSISVFNVDPNKLIRECIRVTKDDGKILLSSYSENIWKERLDWFIQQSKEGLLGEIDLERTREGIIVCKDGFKATTYTPEDFYRLTSEMKLDAAIEEVDQSSLFCIIYVDHN